MKNLKLLLLSFLSASRAKFLEKKFISKSFNAILVLFIILASGYAYTTFENTTLRTISALMVFVLSFSLYILNLDVNLVKYFLKKKKIPFILPSVILVFVLGVSAFITMVFTREFDYLISYAYYGLLILSAFFVIRVFTFETFKSFFIKIMFGLSIISLIFFIFINISGTQFGISTFTNGKNSIYSNYFFVFFQNIYLNRLQSIFWEPGLFSSFLIIALAFEIIDKNKFRIHYVLVFIISIIFTFSTFAYLMLTIVSLLFVNKLVRSKSTRFSVFIIYIFLFLIVVLFANNVFGFLSKILPNVFEKVALQNTSFSTRLLNPKISWLSFLKSPWYGHGIHGMQIDRDLIILDQGFAGNVDAATNTSFSLLATFGVFGSLFTIALILGILFCNEEIFSNKILLLIIFLVIINKEPHTNILLTWIFVFFFIKESFDEKIIQKKYPTIEEKFQIKLFLKGGNDTAVLSKNLVGTILIKGMALIISFFSVSVFSKYFNNDHTYGLWLAILSVLSWIMTFDLGLGNGMKNSLIDSFHRGTEEKSKKIIASSYLSSIFIALFLFLIGVVLALSINLNNLFNISEELVSPALLKTVMIITLFGISLEFVLKNISYIFHSLQKQLYAGIFSFISSLLLFIFAFTFKFQNITLQFVILSVIYVIFYNFPYLIGTIYIFKKPLKNIRPKISDFDTKVAKEVMGVGIIFFLMQISLLFLNSTNSILIANIFGSDVVVYFTKYTKLFNVILSLFTVMTLTLWAAIRKAYVNKNQKWIKKMNFYFHLLAVVMVMLCGTIVLFLQPIFNIWLGDATIIVDWVIALVCFASISVRLFTTVSSAISNGLQTLKPQLICLLTGVIIKIPLVFIIKLLFVNVPWYSIIVVDIMCYIPLLVILPIANYRKIKNMSWKEDSVVS